MPPGGTRRWSDPVFDDVKIDMLAHEGGIAIGARLDGGSYGSASMEAVPGTLPSETSRAGAPGLCLR